MNELEKAKKGEIWSYPGLPPSDAVEIGREVTAQDTIIYYRDKSGEYRYQSKRTIAFEEEMRERELIRQRTKRRARKREGKRPEKEAPADLRTEAI